MDQHASSGGQLTHYCVKTELQVDFGHSADQLFQMAAASLSRGRVKSLHPIKTESNKKMENGHSTRVTIYSVAVYGYTLATSPLLWRTVLLLFPITFQQQQLCKSALCDFTKRMLAVLWRSKGGRIKGAKSSVGPRRTLEPVDTSQRQTLAAANLYC